MFIRAQLPPDRRPTRGLRGLRGLAGQRVEGIGHYVLLCGAGCCLWACRFSGRSAQPWGRAAPWAAREPSAPRASIGALARCPAPFRPGAPISPASPPRRSPALNSPHWTRDVFRRCSIVTKSNCMRLLRKARPCRPRVLQPGLPVTSGALHTGGGGGLAALGAG